MYFLLVAVKGIVHRWELDGLGHLQVDQHHDLWWKISRLPSCDGNVLTVERMAADPAGFHNTNSVQVMKKPRWPICAQGREHNHTDGWIGVSDRRVLTQPYTRCDPPHISKIHTSKQYFPASIYFSMYFHDRSQKSSTI